MATTIIQDGEVTLGGYKFPIAGNVEHKIISSFPTKYTLGDDTYSNEVLLSNIIFNDQRGGILLEELMDDTQLNRSWWSTLNGDFPGYLCLPHLATALSMPTILSIVDGGMETWTTSTNLTNWTETLSGGDAAVNREATTIYAGTYACKLSGSGGVNAKIDQDLTGWSNDYRGKSISLIAYLQTDVDKDHLVAILDDGVGSTSVSPSAAGSYLKITINHTFDASATKANLSFTLTAGVGAETAYIDAVQILIGTGSKWADFNGSIYFSVSNNLYKFTSAAAVSLIRTFPATITQLVASIGTNLYIFLGDDDEYWYMDTSEAFTETDVTGSWAIEWGTTKLFMYRCDTNTIYYATVPNNATPSWTANGVLSIPADTCEKLFVGSDGSGNLVIYASTNYGLYAHDYANACFWATKALLPNHPTGGMGGCEWNNYSYISSGLDTLQYGAIAGTLAHRGLDMDDGLPALRGGEIVDFYPGFNELFALVDSTYEGATSRSGVYIWNGSSWACRWECGSDNISMYSGFVSSVYAYRYWFSTSAGIYWMTLQRNIRNPKKISTFTYAAAGVHITPWLNCGTAVFAKLATKLSVLSAGNSATETIIVKYRIDHTYTDIATGWTTLGTIVAAGLSTYTFASSVGVSFKSIQFRFDYARGGTTTVTPSIQAVTFSYRKLNKFYDAWTFSIPATETYANLSLAQMETALNTLMTTETLLTFTYRDGRSANDTHYVLIYPPLTQLAKTGEHYESTYQVTVVEP